MDDFKVSVSYLVVHQAATHRHAIWVAAEDFRDAYEKGSDAFQIWYLEHVSVRAPLIEEVTVTRL